MSEPPMPSVARVAPLLALLALPLPSLGQDAQEIVARADQVRNPDRAFRFDLALTEYVAGKPVGQNALAIYSKKDPATGQFRNLVLYVQPPGDAGKAVLLDGRAFWFYDPASKSSVRISPQQRLIGQAAVGDVLTVSLAVDYLATLASVETVQDASRQAKTCWHMDLKASNELSTYAHVEYWIEQGTYRPVKLKFYSDSGRLLKILYYRAFEDWLGGKRPTEAVILDAVDSSRVTTAKSSGQRAKEIPETWFQREFLPRFQGE